MEASPILSTLMLCAASAASRRSIAIGADAVGRDSVCAGECRGAEEAAAEARAFLVGPVDEANGDGRLAVVSSADGARTSKPVRTPSAPSSQPPLGTESRWLPRTSA